MDNISPDIEMITSEPEKAQEMVININDNTPHYIHNMEAITFDQLGDNYRRGYNILFKRCDRCQTEYADTDTQKVTICNQCSHTSFHAYDGMYGDAVEEIINKVVKYKCRTCGRLYNQPSDCCVDNYRQSENSLSKKKGAYYRGFICLGCKRIYDYKVECCSDAKMISGQYMIPENEQSTRLLLGV